MVPFIFVLFNLFLRRLQSQWCFEYIKMTFRKRSVDEALHHSHQREQRENQHILADITNVPQEQMREQNGGEYGEDVRVERAQFGGNKC